MSPACEWCCEPSGQGACPACKKFLCSWCAQEHHCGAKKRKKPPADKVFNEHVRLKRQIVEAIDYRLDALIKEESDESGMVVKELLKLRSFIRNGCLYEKKS